jgi:hypothetical protein
MESLGIHSVKRSLKSSPENGLLKDQSGNQSPNSARAQNILSNVVLRTSD